MQAKHKMPDLDSLGLFDSCMTLGRIVHPNVPECITAENVIAVLDRYHIGEALVHDHHARMVYPREHGNRRLIEAIRGSDRLHPVWVIAPPKTSGSDAADAFIDEMLDAGVKVARLPMKRLAPLGWLWDDLCGALEKHRIPCFLDFGDVSTQGDLTHGDVAGIREIALAHPQLPLVLSHIMGGLGVHPALMHLVRRVENLYIDVAGLLEYWRETASEVGPDRVLFATGAPFTDPGILISNIQYATGFNEEAKRMMCGDNLRRLIGGAR